MWKKVGVDMEIEVGEYIRTEKGFILKLNDFPHMTYHQLIFLIHNQNSNPPYLLTWK